MVTSNFVANGSEAGVKMSVVVPDQRNVPFTAGAMWNHGTARSFGILPTTTIGSLKTTRTSFASARVATSPTGPALTMVSFSAATAATAANVSRRSRLRRFISAHVTRQPRSGGAHDRERRHARGLIRTRGQALDERRPAAQALLALPSHAQPAVRRRRFLRARLIGHQRQRRIELQRAGSGHLDLRHDAADALLAKGDEVRGAVAHLRRVLEERRDVDRAADADDVRAAHAQRERVRLPVDDDRGEQAGR